MAEILKKIHINPFVLITIIFFWLIGRVNELLIIFISITIHELGHLLIAKCFNININKLALTPIGFMANINYSDYKRYYHEIIISIAGPAVNLLAALAGYIISLYFLDKFNNIGFFILVNFSLAFINILPILPLDGGKIFRAALFFRLGYNPTRKIFSVVSKTISIALICLGIYQIFICGNNVSLLLIGIFLYIYIYKEKDEMQYFLIGELIYKKKKLREAGALFIEYIACFEDIKIIEIVKKIRSNRYHIAKVLDNNMDQKGEITETEMLECLTIYGAQATMERALKHYILKGK